MSTTTATTRPEVPLPVGFDEADEWQASGLSLPYRVIWGGNRTVTDHEVVVSNAAVQWADGSIDDGRVGAPSAALLNGRSDTGVRLNSDQSRALAAALLAAADELDGLKDHR
jgi:hypothetical protein